MCRFQVIIFFALLCNDILSEDIYRYTVAKDSSGDFTSIQQAINACKAFPDKRIYIFIKNGIYREKVKVHQWNNKISLIGEDTEKTIITYDDYFDRINLGRNSTFHTWTLLVEGDDFTAENITIENSAGPVGQAVALSVNADRCIFRNCRFLGNQDTIFTGGLNDCMYFVGCYIEGTTDFIFGQATVIFDSCVIFSKANSYITAASTPKGKTFGYVFRKCTLNAGQNVNNVFLGRPWRTYARVAFIECYMNDHIAAEGWHHWNKIISDSTFYFAEYNNTGPGADLTRRVSWSYQIPDTVITNYTLKNIFRDTTKGIQNEWYNRTFDKE